MRPLALAVMLCIAVSGGGPARADAMSVPPDPPASAAAAMRGALADALQAQGIAAIAALKSLDATQLSAGDASIRTCMIGRLGARQPAPASVADPFVAAVLRSYQEYWLRALRSEHPAAQNEAWLLGTLNRLLTGAGARPAADMGDLEGELEPLLLAHGYHALLGVTRPLRELMLWRSEVQARYQVTLPEGEQPVVVIFMDEFASLGWAGFATCDRHHSGGWTRPGRLYAVRSAYDLDSEEFRVSYLAHEAQHFADNQRFPGLDDQAQLEYRAKLAELATARTSVYQLLEAFAANTSPDPAIPHSFANRRLVHDLSQRLFPSATKCCAWIAVPVTSINAAALQLLREDSARLTHTGAA